MKVKLGAFICFAGLLVCLCACTSRVPAPDTAPQSSVSEASQAPQTEADIRETIYNQLPAEKKEQITSAWSEAELRTVTLSREMGYDIEEAYIDRQVYLIDFPNKEGINNLVVYAATDDVRIIGYGLID